MAAEEGDSREPVTKEVRLLVPIEKSADRPKRISYGVVLEPDTEDLQGDVMTAEDIEAAAYDWMERSQAGGHMHTATVEDAKVVESYIAPCDIPIETAEGRQTIRKGSWVLAMRWPEEIWESIAKGDLTGYSVGGTGVRLALEEIGKNGKWAPGPNAGWRLANGEVYQGEGHADYEPRDPANRKPKVGDVVRLKEDGAVGTIVDYEPGKDGALDEYAIAPEDLEEGGPRAIWVRADEIGTVEGPGVPKVGDKITFRDGVEAKVVGLSREHILVEGPGVPNGTMAVAYDDIDSDGNISLDAEYKPRYRGEYERPSAYGGGLEEQYRGDPAMEGMAAAGGGTPADQGAAAALRDDRGQAERAAREEAEWKAGYGEDASQGWEAESGYKTYTRGQKVRTRSGQIRTIHSQRGAQVFVEEESNGWYHPSNLTRVYWSNELGWVTIPDREDEAKKSLTGIVREALDEVVKDKGWAPGPNAGWRREDGSEGAESGENREASPIEARKVKVRGLTHTRAPHKYASFARPKDPEGSAFCSGPGPGWQGGDGMSSTNSLEDFRPGMRVAGRVADRAGCYFKDSDFEDWDQWMTGTVVGETKLKGEPVGFVNVKWDKYQDNADAGGTAPHGLWIKTGKVKKLADQNQKSLTDIVREGFREALDKHAHHDQSTHGNWARGGGLRTADYGEFISGDRVKLASNEKIDWGGLEGATGRVIEVKPGTLGWPAIYSIKLDREWVGWEDDDTLRDIEATGLAMLRRVRKHGSHNQKDHGNWARGERNTEQETRRDESSADLLDLFDSNLGATVKLDGHAYKVKEIKPFRFVHGLDAVILEPKDKSGVWYREQRAQLHDDWLHEVSDPERLVELARQLPGWDRFEEVTKDKGWAPGPNAGWRRITGEDGQPKKHTTRDGVVIEDQPKVTRVGGEQYQIAKPEGQVILNFGEWKWTGSGKSPKVTERGSWAVWPRHRKHNLDNLIRSSSRTLGELMRELPPGEYDLAP